MKRTVSFIAIALFLFLCVSLSAEEMPDTTNAREGNIRASVGIGMGTVEGSYLIVFPINMIWVDTGIDVAGGDTVTIVAEPARNHPPCDGSTGCPPYRDADDIMVYGALGKGLTALVGRIGDEGEPFSIGKEYRGTISEVGRLFVGYNDGRASWGDNTGSFEVTITVTGR